jgi:hypothetical protein
MMSALTSRVNAPRSVGACRICTVLSPPLDIEPAHEENTAMYGTHDELPLANFVGWPIFAIESSRRGEAFEDARVL